MSAFDEVSITGVSSKAMRRLCISGEIAVLYPGHHLEA